MGGAAKLRWGGGGAQRPVGSGNKPKKTGARSARARMRGQNPLVLEEGTRRPAEAPIEAAVATGEQIKRREANLTEAKSIEANAGGC